MKQIKKLILPAICLLLLIAVAIMGTYAWFYRNRDSMVLVAGDIEIKVKSAKYAFACVDENEKEAFIFDENEVAFHDLDEAKLNTVPMAFGEFYVIYEFVIHNPSAVDVNLCLRLSEFSDYLFKGIRAYAENSEDPKLPYINYTAKNILQIKYLNYSYDPDASEKPLDDANIEWISATRSSTDPIAHLWDYSYGKYIIGETGSYPSIRLKTAPQDEEDPQQSDPSSSSATAEHGISDTVTIRLAIEENFDHDALSTYYAWLGQENGYGWKYCSNLLGDRENKDTLIRNYLDAVILGEQNAIDEAIRATAGSEKNFQLTINYFEFIGNNIPYEGSFTIE